MGIALARISGFYALSFNGTNNGSFWLLLNKLFSERFFQLLFCGCFTGTFASLAVLDFLS